MFKVQGVLLVFIFLFGFVELSISQNYWLQKYFFQRSPWTNVSPYRLQ